MGGVGGMYGSQANDAMGGLGQLGSLLPSILRLQGGSNPNAGNNMLGTNQKTGYNPNDPTGGGIDANLYPDQNRVMGPQSQGRKGMRIFGMNMG